MGRNRRNSRRATASIRRVGFAIALLIALLVGILPAWAAVTGPGSAHVLPGAAVGVSMSTDGTLAVAINGSHGGISVVRSGSVPTFRFTFTVGTSVNPGSYSYAFTDGAGSKPFTLIVDTPPPTTTTTKPPPTTTTTKPPPTTTTTEPVTTTTLDEPPTISITGGNATEGKAVWFTVTLSGAYSEVITVNYTTADGTATAADNDYSLLSGVLTFSPGDTSETIGVPTGGDTTDEPDEDFGMTLSSPTNATIIDGSATGVINDDDLTRAEVASQDTIATSSTTSLAVAVAAPDDGDRTSGLSGPLLGGGLLLLLAIAGGFIYSRRREPVPRSGNRSPSLRTWWYTSGPMVSYQERKSGRQAAKELQLRIEQRRNLKDE